MLVLLALLLGTSSAFAGSTTDVPYFLQSVSNERDVAGINENFRAMYLGIAALQSTVSGIGSGNTTSVANSTHTLIPAGSTTQSGNKVAFATVTLTTDGSSPITLQFTCPFTQTSAYLINWGVLVDSANNKFGQSATSSLGVIYDFNGGPFTGFPPRTFPGSSLSAGSHTFALTIYNVTNTNTIAWPASYDGETSVGCDFWVKEEH